MKGIEVIKIFEENGLLASELVDAVYDGLYPVHFGAVLKPHNCLTCIYAEPPAEVTQAKTDPGACHNQIPRKYQAGLSYCSHTRLGEANGMMSDAGMEGTCKGGYSVIEDADLLERLKDCEFVRAEVEEFLDDLLPGRHRLPIAPRPVVIKPQQSISLINTQESEETKQMEDKCKAKRTWKREKLSIPTTPDTTWSQIKIRIANNSHIEIARPGYATAPFDPVDLGFEPARQGDVTMWGVLEFFARGKGSLPPASKDTVIGKSNITNFRKLLKNIFPDISGTPVKHWHPRRGYQCEFQISASEHYLSGEHHTPDKRGQGEDYTELIANKRS